MTACTHSSVTRVFHVPVDVKAGRGTKFNEVVACDVCQQMFVQPMPLPEEVPANYDLPAYYTHGVGHIKPKTPTTAERAVAHLAWRLDKGHRPTPADLLALAGTGPGTRILDIGCGAGKNLDAFAELGATATGIEPDPDARKLASSKGHRVLPGTAEDIPSELAGETFDVIVMSHVLEHTLDPNAALVNARRHLAKEGIFYCEVPNAGSHYFQTYGHISEMLDVPRHLHFFDKRALGLLAQNAGLEIEKWTNHGFCRHYAASWKAWENEIHGMLVKAGTTPLCAPRSIRGDLRMIARTRSLPPERIYDCVGFIAKART